MLEQGFGDFLLCCAKVKFQQRFVLDVADAVPFFVIRSCDNLFPFNLTNLLLIAETNPLNQGFPLGNLAYVRPGIDHINIQIAALLVMGNAIVGDPHLIEQRADTKVRDIRHIHRNLFIRHPLQHLNLDAGLLADLAQNLPRADIVRYK